MILSMEGVMGLRCVCLLLAAAIGCLSLSACNAVGDANLEDTNPSVIESNPLETTTDVWQSTTESYLQNDQTSAKPLETTTTFCSTTVTDTVIYTTVTATTAAIITDWDDNAGWTPPVRP